MRKTKQVLFSFLTFVAPYYFLFWILEEILAIPFHIDPPNWILAVSGILNFLIAI
jgi:hypothetical protein